MYIIFDSKGKVEIIHYQEIPEVFKDRRYVEMDERDIPEKEGHNTIISMNENDEVEFTFEEIKPTRDEELEKLKKELEDLKSVNKANMLALMEVNSKLLDLEVDK